MSGDQVQGTLPSGSQVIQEEQPVDIKGQAERQDAAQNTLDRNDDDDDDDNDNHHEMEPVFVQAQYAFVSPNNSSLSFAKGDVIEVLTQLRSGWWDGLLDDQRGWFPSNYVTKITLQEAEAWFSSREHLGRDQGMQDELRDDLSSGVPSSSVGHVEQDVMLLADSNEPESNVVEQHLVDTRDSPSAERSDSLNGHPGLEGLDKSTSQEDGGEDENLEDFWVPSMTEDGQV